MPPGYRPGVERACERCGVAGDEELALVVAADAPAGDPARHELWCSACRAAEPHTEVE